MNEVTLLSALFGTVLTGGIVLAVWALFLAPPPDRGRPPGRLKTFALRIWRGRSRSRAEQRRHQVLLVAAVVAGAAGWLLTGLPVLGLVIGAGVPGVPWLLAAGGSEKRNIARVEAVGEWTRRLRDVAGTGAGLQAAIVSSSATAPEAISEDVRLLAARLQAGWNGSDALARFADEIDDAVCDQVVAALLLHLRDRGDRLGAVLGSISEATAKEVSTRKEVNAERASARFSIRFMVVFTILAVVIAAFSGDYMEPYTSGFGQVFLAGLCSAFIGLLVWARSMSLPARSPRLLSRAAGGGD